MASTSDERVQLEASLLRDPFNVGVRLAYADLLRARGAPNEALAQYEILIGQPAGPAAAYVGAALALLELGRRDEAMRRYRAARDAPGFTSDSSLEALEATKRRGEPVRLTVLPGAGGSQPAGEANVIPFAAPAGRAVRFADIAGMEDLKRTVRLQIIEPFLRPGLFARFRKRAGGGILLYGPPGCGKTMLARALATECRAQFVSVGISDVLNMYIGESERSLAQVFARARASRPSVLFFDELDALAFARSKAVSEHTRQVVNEFLAQLDGFGADNEQVLVLAATNMPWDVDPAMKRPGRFARQVFVPPPDEPARARLVELKLAGVPHEGVDARVIAAATPQFSGADIEGAVELAKEYVLEEHLSGGSERPIGQADLLRAVRAVQPSTLEWLRTARNLVRYGGADDAYRDVDAWLRANRLS